MRRSYKYRLYPNVTQTRLLEEILETHRRLYNAALAERQAAWHNEKRTVLFDHQSAAFLQERKTNEWYKKVHSHSGQSTLRRLDQTFKYFFQRVKQGKPPGYPRFKSRNQFNSIPFNQYGNGVKFRENKLHVFAVGQMRIKVHREPQGKIKTVSLKREGEKWYAVLSCDLGNLVIEPSTNPPVGIDLGIDSFVTTSNGESYPNQRILAANLPELKRRQRAISRKKKGGSNRRKAMKRVSQLHTRIKNLRHEHHHRVALDLIRRYGVVALESLDIKHMLLGNRGTARSIGDAAWGIFVSTLKCKAESAGVRVVDVDPQYTSQTCSRCGHCEKANRESQKVFRCIQCDHIENADVNASKNILARGLAWIGPAEGNVVQRDERSPRKSKTPGTVVRPTRCVQKTLWDWLDHDSSSGEKD